MLTDSQSGARESSTVEARPVAVSPVDLAEDPQAQAGFQTLLTGCGVYPLSHRSKIILTGEDRTRWLNGMVTNNIRDLAAGQGVYAFLLNPQGRIQGDLYAFNRADSIVLDVESEQAAKLLEILDHYIVMDDVQVEDAANRYTGIGVQGPQGPAVVEAAAFALPHLALLQFVDLEWNGVTVTIVRAEAWKGFAYEIWLAPEHAPVLLNALRQAGAVEVGAGAQRLYRIASGIPQFGEDIRERDLPQETGQERALHFAKGCYVGQEIVERIRSRGQVHRVFSGLELTAPATPGDKITADDKDVGEITSVATFAMPEGPKMVALGYLRREAFLKALTVHGAPVQRRELPFHEILQH